MHIYGHKCPKIRRKFLKTGLTSPDLTKNCESLQKNQGREMFHSSHFSLLVSGHLLLAMKLRKYYLIVWGFFSFCLARLALETENIVQKITQLK